MARGDRGRREVQRDRGLEEARVEVEGQLAQDPLALPRVADVFDGGGVLRRVDLEELAQHGMEGSEDPHAGGGEERDAFFDRVTVEGRAVEGPDHDPLDTDLDEGATGLPDRGAGDVVRNVPRAAAWRGFDPDLEIAGEQERPLGAHARQSLVESAGEAFADQPVVVQRQVRAVVLDGIDEEVDGGARRDERASVVVGAVEERDRVHRAGLRGAVSRGKAASHRGDERRAHERVPKTFDDAAPTRRQGETKVPSPSLTMSDNHTEGHTPCSCSAPCRTGSPGSSPSRSR
jgi:hypothetical protein